MRHYVDYCAGLRASSKQHRTEQGREDVTSELDHRLNAESILANALICPFGTFFGPAPSSKSPSLPALPPLPRSVVLVEASMLCPDGRSEIVSSLLFSLVAPVVCLLFLAPLPFPRFLWGGGEPKISPTGLGCICLGISFNSHGTPVITIQHDVSIDGQAGGSVGHVRLTFGGGRLPFRWSYRPLLTLYLLPFAFLQLPPEMFVATVEELLLLYLVNAEDEVVALLMLFVVLMLDLQLLLAIELALEARYLPLLVDVGDTPRFSTLSAHLSMWDCDPVTLLLPYGEFFLRPRVYVESSKGCRGCVGPWRTEVCCLEGDREDLGGGGLNPKTRFVTLLAVLDICLPSTVTDSSTAGLGVGTMGLRSPLLLPKVSFHFDGFLVTVGVGGTASLGIGGTGISEGPMTYPLPEILEVLLISLASVCEASARVSRVRSTCSV